MSLMLVSIEVITYQNSEISEFRRHRGHFTGNVPKTCNSIRKSCFWSTSPDARSRRWRAELKAESKAKAAECDHGLVSSYIRTTGRLLEAPLV